MFRSASVRPGAVALTTFVGIGMLVLPAPVAAQEAARNVAGPAFTPSLTLFGSLSNNPERLPGATSDADFFALVADFPWAFRGPRFSGFLSYSPGFQRFRQDSTLDSFDSSLALQVQGRLSPRTTLEIAGHGFLSSDLQPPEFTEVVLPRVRQLQGELDASLDYSLGPRDTLSLSGQYERQSFPDGEFVGRDGFGAGVGYARALTPRTNVVLASGAQLVDFDNGTRARTLSATSGFDLRLSPTATLALEGGALWVQENLGEGWIDLGGPGLLARGRLSVAAGRYALGLSASRDSGFAAGIGSATLRDRVVGSVATGARRWSAVAVAGFTRNAAFSNRSAAAAQLPDGRRLQTLSGCVGGTVRVSRAIAVVGAALLAHQVSAQELDALRIESYRISLGLRVQANGTPLGASGDAARLDFNGIARSSDATCR